MNSLILYTENYRLLAVASDEIFSGALEALKTLQADVGSRRKIITKKIPTCDKHSVRYAAYIPDIFLDINGEWSCLSATSRTKNCAVIGLLREFLNFASENQNGMLIVGKPEKPKTAARVVVGKAPEL